MDKAAFELWFQESGDEKTLSLVRQCEFSYDYMDTGFAMNGGPDIDILQLRIRVPKRIHDQLNSIYEKEVREIESAASNLAAGENCTVRQVLWFAGVSVSPRVTVNQEIENALKELGAGQV